MSTDICPYCKDFTKQDALTTLPGTYSSHSGIKSKIDLSICHQCGQTIEHEEVILFTPENSMVIA